MKNWTIGTYYHLSQANQPDSNSHLMALLQNSIWNYAGKMGVRRVRQKLMDYWVFSDEEQEEFPEEQWYIIEPTNGGMALKRVLLCWVAFTQIPVGWSAMDWIFLVAMMERWVRFLSYCWQVQNYKIHATNCVRLIQTYQRTHKMMMSIKCTQLHMILWKKA